MKELTLRVDDAIYEQFINCLGLFRCIEVVSEKVVMRRKGGGGRPRQSDHPTAAFIYDQPDARWRLTMLCNGLKALGWIDAKTDRQLFVDSFSGGDVTRKIVWTGDINTLAELFRRLVKERQLVTLPAKRSLWKMVNGHFFYKKVSDEIGTDRLRCTHKPYKQGQTIAYLVNFLDPRFSYDDLEKIVKSMR